MVCRTSKSRSEISIGNSDKEIVAAQIRKVPIKLKIDDSDYSISLMFNEIVDKYLFYSQSTISLWQKKEISCFQFRLKHNK
ncbi:MAG: hypothetical protein A2X11_12435 [Bacteroidetes bacterium GWE2_42_24]|nr:MAG: hypothetical protein A2X11_12435 [Bacteroidetes bacterium GWE2_42_24]OFY30585.1 MAG: hypothetical protein A2X09_03680 [Bacteroidetes bacterium GWF2_43_11]